MIDLLYSVGISQVKMKRICIKIIKMTSHYYSQLTFF